MSETLTWDGELLTGPIVCEDLGVLRAFMARGSNRVLPGAPGTRALPLVMDELDVTLVWAVTGRVAPVSGTPHASQELGVELNLEHYRTLFTTGADPVTGEHDLVLTTLAGTFEGEAQLRDYAPVRTGPSTARIVTRLVVAAGELEATSS